MKTPTSGKQLPYVLQSYLISMRSWFRIGDFSINFMSFSLTVTPWLLPTQLPPCLRLGELEHNPKLRSRVKYSIQTSCSSERVYRMGSSNHPWLNIILFPSKWKSSREYYWACDTALTACELRCCSFCRKSNSQSAGGAWWIIWICKTMYHLVCEIYT